MAEISLQRGTFTNDRGTFDVDYVYSDGKRVGHISESNNHIFGYCDNGATVGYCVRATMGNRDYMARAVVDASAAHNGGE